MTRLTWLSQTMLTTTVMYLTKLTRHNSFLNHRIISILVWWAEVDLDNDWYNSICRWLKACQLHQRKGFELLLDMMTVWSKSSCPVWTLWRHLYCAGSTNRPVRALMRLSLFWTSVDVFSSSVIFVGIKIDCGLLTRPFQTVQIELLSMIETSEDFDIGKIPNVFSCPSYIVHFGRQQQSWEILRHRQRQIAWNWR